MTHRLEYAVLALMLIINAGCYTTLSNDKLRISVQDDQQRSQDELLPIRYFDENILLSTNDEIYPHHVEVTMAITENDVMFVGWKNSETHNGGGARVSYVKSTDYGMSWTNPRDMPMFAVGFDTRQSDPWMAWHDGSLYYAYLEYNSDEEFSQITIAKSTDFGETWDPVKASFGHGFADKETMVVSSDGSIYMAYDDVEDAGVTVELTRSLDGGSLYETGGIIGELHDDHLAPYLALSSAGDIYCAWSSINEEGGDILFDRSLDGGVTFGQEVFVNNDGNYSAWTTAGGRPAKVTLPVLRFDDDDRLYLLWADLYEDPHDTFDVFLRYSDDYGQTWSPRLRVNPRVEENQWNPEVAIDSEGTLHIIYYNDGLPFGYKPCYRSLKFTGPLKDTPEFGNQLVIASAPTDLTFTRPGEYFAIVLDSDEIPHVAWSDGRNDEMDVYYAVGVPEYPDEPTSTTTTTTYTYTTTTTTTDGEELLIVQVARWFLIIGGIAGLVAVIAIIWNRRAGFG